MAGFDPSGSKGRKEDWVRRGCVTVSDKNGGSGLPFDSEFINDSATGYQKQEIVSLMNKSKKVKLI